MHEYLLLLMGVANHDCTLKGLLIGTHFAMKGIFQLFGVIFIYTLISVGCDCRNQFPICSFVYFLVNILIGLIALVLVVRKYI